MTVTVGLLGYPVRHSVSAAFHQAAFDHLGMKAEYMLWEVPPEDLAEKLGELRNPDHLGANVTIPHKEAVIPLLDHVDTLARPLGAVNTIVNQEGHSPLSAASIPPRILVYDLVYNPPETPLLGESLKAGARTLNGLTMLVYQGAAS